MHPTHWRTLATLLQDISLMPLHLFEDNFLYLLEGITELGHASSAFAVFVRRLENTPSCDPLQGWRPIHVTYLNPLPLDHTIRESLESTIEDTEREAHEGIRAHIPMMGSHRSMLWSDLVPGQRFAESEDFDLYDTLDIHDRMFAVLHLDPQLEVFFCLDRPSSLPLFSSKDRATMNTVLPGLWGPTMRYCQAYGLLEKQEQLTPRERETLGFLLQGLAEKEIALELGVTARSAHQYVTTIYRKLQVNSRAQLMSRWLSPPTMPVSNDTSCAPWNGPKEGTAA